MSNLRVTAEQEILRMTYISLYCKQFINPFTAMYFSVQIKHEIGKNINSVQQQCEHHHQKVLIESFHLSGHTFMFRWPVQDLEVFLV